MATTRLCDVRRVDEVCVYTDAPLAARAQTDMTQSVERESDNGTLPFSFSLQNLRAAICQIFDFFLFRPRNNDKHPCARHAIHLPLVVALVCVVVRTRPPARPHARNSTHTRDAARGHKTWEKIIT
jgi:hypothetical protein